MADSSLPTTSTAASSFLTNGDGRQGDDAKVGMIIVGIVLLFLFCMVVLRYGCNLLIDIFVLRDGDSLVRTISELRRLLCPCWHPRTEPTAVGVGAGGAGDAGGSGNNDGGTDESVSMETLLTGLTQKQKQELLASVVPSKVRTMKRRRRVFTVRLGTCHDFSLLVLTICFVPCNFLVDGHQSRYQTMETTEWYPVGCVSLGQQ